MSTSVLQSSLPVSAVASAGGKAANGNHGPPPDLPKVVAAPPKRGVHWEYWRAVGAEGAWTLVTKSSLLVVYFVFISEGIRRVAPEMTTKLHKLPIPFVVHLEDYESTHELDVAHVAAVLLLILSFASWHFLLQWVLSDEFKAKFRKWNWNMAWVERILLIGASLIIVGDMGLFYESFNQSVFGNSAFSAKSLVATLVYGVILVVVNFVSLYLSRSTREVLSQGNVVKQ